MLKVIIIVQSNYLPNTFQKSCSSLKTIITYTFSAQYKCVYWLFFSLLALYLFGWYTNVCMYEYVYDGNMNMAHHLAQEQLLCVVYPYAISNWIPIVHWCQNTKRPRPFCTNANYGRRQHGKLNGPSIE